MNIEVSNGAAPRKTARSVERYPGDHHTTASGVLPVVDEIPNSARLTGWRGAWCRVPASAIQGRPTSSAPRASPARPFLDRGQSTRPASSFLPGEPSPGLSVPLPAKLASDGCRPGLRVGTCVSKDAPQIKSKRWPTDLCTELSRGNFFDSSHSVHTVCLLMSSNYLRMIPFRVYVVCTESLKTTLSRSNP